MVNKETLLVAIIHAVNVPKRLHSFDFGYLGNNGEAVRFSYGKKRFRVSLHGFVEEVGNGVLISNPAAKQLETKIRGFLANV